MQHPVTSGVSSADSLIFSIIILLPLSHPGTPRTSCGVVIVTISIQIHKHSCSSVKTCLPEGVMFGGRVFIPVEDGWALVADRGVTVEGEEDVSFLTQLTHKSFGLTTLHTHTHTYTVISLELVKQISMTLCKCKVPCRFVLNGRANLTV